MKISECFIKKTVRHYAPSAVEKEARRAARQFFLESFPDHAATLGSCTIIYDPEESPQTLFKPAVRWVFSFVGLADNRLVLTVQPEASKALASTWIFIKGFLTASFISLIVFKFLLEQR